MTDSALKEYTDTCFDELVALQENLKKEYGITRYENWFYDQSTSLFTLSTNDDEINFKYVSVGTYSRNTNTWKWSWDNENINETVKSGILEVKEFGIKNRLKSLTSGYFEATEKNAWDFTAITAKILNGIGSYRAVSEHLLIFMVLTEFVEKEKAQIIKDSYISCNKHGSKRRAFICRHLNKIEKLGFEEAFDSEPGMELNEEEDFSAWCNLCELARAEEGEWNDKSMKFAKIRLVCEECYFEIKKHNLTP